ncbi:hypothetical protein [Planomonospora sp. ID67723]|uniref:hypothetical protein n=1 Tax=Planomonospora sp. ID67723 TaxID=2738134 RepID=UPI001E39959C|nr:hypothetical protein [Planomonospora sp. ID67723]
MLARGLDAFAANDYLAWRWIMDLTRIPRSRTILADCRSDPSRRRLVRDYTGLRALTDRMGVTGRVDLDWHPR